MNALATAPVADPSAVPPVFVSHGSPMIALEPGETGRFLGELGARLRSTHTIRAILAISAHTCLPSAGQGRGPAVAMLGAPNHQAIYDFGGFSPELYSLRYDAEGDPSLARSIADRLGQAGWQVALANQGGLDHGIWTTLRFAFAAADVPVLPLAWPQHAGAERLYELGQALAPFARDGVLIWATGSITHNLRRVFSQPQAHGTPAEDMPEIAESAAFRHWWADRAAAGDRSALFDWQRQAPHARDMHPTAEHLLPWFVAAGAADSLGTRLRRVHQGVTFGCLGMDAYCA